jgi:small subunit ribosomal protein S9
MEVINTLGRRKTAVARVYLKDGQGIITVNGRDFKNYFPTPILQFKVTEPFEVTNNQGKYDVKVTLAGGGIRGQAEASTAFKSQRASDA